MNGLQLAKAFYAEYGKPMLEEQFAPYLERIAVGLVGHGSECFGFDDVISTDHDFDAGFCLWLTEEDEKDFGFKLFRAYDKLPKEYKGVKRQQDSLFGSDSKGVHTIQEFYSFYLPGGRAPLTLEEWLSIPDSTLAEATNGEIFSDPLGEFTAVRRQLENQPEDVRLKKLASAVLYMAQTGQYNYSRCLAHGERGAAALALSEFARHTAHAAHLLNHRYMPYYKWAFRSLQTLPILGHLTGALTALLETPYDEEKNLPLIEEIAGDVEAVLREQGLSDRTEAYLEGYAYCVQNKIKNAYLRNSAVML